VNHASVQPLTRAIWHERTRTDRTVIVGHMAACPCGWIGEPRKQPSFAVADARWHECRERR
jgi:hypothetical protein